MARPALEFADIFRDHGSAWRDANRGFGLKAEWLVAEPAYGSAPNLHFLVDEKNIAPHFPVIDKNKREEGIFTREALSTMTFATSLYARRATPTT